MDLFARRPGLSKFNTNILGSSRKSLGRMGNTRKLMKIDTSTYKPPSSRKRSRKSRKSHRFTRSSAPKVIMGELNTVPAPTARSGSLINDTFMWVIAILFVIGIAVTIIQTSPMSTEHVDEDSNDEHFKEIYTTLDNHRTRHKRHDFLLDGLETNVAKLITESAASPAVTGGSGGTTLPVGLTSVLYANAGAFADVTIGGNLDFTAPTLDTIQDIATTSSPTFGGLTLTGKTSLLYANAGVLTDVTLGDGVQFSAGSLSVDHNTTNLKITGVELDTIQGIATTSSPVFGGLTLTGKTSLLYANAGVLTDATLGDGVQFSAGSLSVDHNTTNLKITGVELDTIQGIATTATPQWARVGIGAAANSTAGLLIATGSDSSATANSGFLIIGDPTSAHLTMDDNEIMAKSSSTAFTTLSLNSDGGLVSTGSGGISTSGNVTIGGNLTVNGTSVTLDASTVVIEDSMIKLASNNASNITDFGVYGLYSDDGGTTDEFSGIFFDATDKTWTVFHSLEDEPGTTVDIGGTGYALSDFKCAGLSSSGLTISGLTASRLVATDGSKNLASVSDFTSWIADSGTGNISVAASGGGVTLNTAQDILTSSSPTFGGLTLTGKTSLIYANTGVLTDVALGDGVQFSAGTLSVDFNTTNLKITSTELNTVQDIAVTSSPTFVDITLSSLTFGSPTYSTVQQYLSTAGSSGVISGFSISRIASNFSVSSGSVYIRATDDDLAPLLSVDISALALTVIADQETIYVGVTYNGGAPKIFTQSTEAYNYNTTFPLYTVYNHGGHLHSNETKMIMGNHASLLILKDTNIHGFVRDTKVGGLVLSNTGTRNLVLTAGVVWEGLVQHTISAVDTSGLDSFTSHYYTGAAWVHTESETQWDNTQYNDILTGLTALSNNNKYANHWVYVETTGGIITTYGQAEFGSLAEALEESPPSFVTGHIEINAILVARLTFKKNDATPRNVSSAFDTEFVSSVATAHNDLANLQGGTADEYYHLTNAVYLNLYQQDQEVLIASSPTFVGATFSGLNASKLVGTNGSKVLESVTLQGTSNQITVSGTSTITLATPQDIATTSSVQFGALTLSTAVTNQILIVGNSTAADADTDETTEINFGLISGETDNAKIVVGKDADYQSAANKDSHMKFYVDLNGSSTLAMTVDSSQNLTVANNISTSAGTIGGLSSTELGYLDGATNANSLASKAVIMDGSKNIVLDSAAISGGTSVTCSTFMRIDTGADGPITLTPGAPGGGYPGVQLLSKGMDANDFTPALQFGSTDTSFTTENPKILAGIVGRALHAYGSDTTGAMNLEFWVTGWTGAAATTPAPSMRLENRGLVLNHLWLDDIGDITNIADNMDIGLVIKQGANFTEVSPSGYMYGYLLIENSGATDSMLFDVTQIQARTGATYSTLHLNQWGGAVTIGNDGHTSSNLTTPIINVKHASNAAAINLSSTAATSIPPMTLAYARVANDFFTNAVDGDAIFKSASTSDTSKIHIGCSTYGTVTAAELIISNNLVSVTTALASVDITATGVTTSGTVTTPILNVTHASNSSIINFGTPSSEEMELGYSKAISFFTNVVSGDAIWKLSASNKIHIGVTPSGTEVAEIVISNNSIAVNGSLTLSSTIQGLYLAEPVTDTVYISSNDGGGTCSASNGVFIGRSCGYQATGSYNTAVGYSSSWLLTGGTYNCTYGYQCGQYNVSGNYNATFGANAGVSLTGSYNTISGSGACNLLTGSGSYNCAYGYQAMYGSAVACPDYCTAVGYQSLLAINGAATGDNNTALGASSGAACTSGSANLFLGANSGDNLTTGSNCISIGSVNFASVTASDQFILGNATNTLMTGSFSDQSVAFLGALSVTGDVTTTSKIWNSAYINRPNTGTYVIGNSAISGTTTHSIYIGDDIGAGTDSSITGSYNLVMGYRAGYELESSTNCIFFGRNSGWHCHDITDCIFLGAYAGENHAISGGGHDCIAIGTYALRTNASGTASGTNIVAIGHYAGEYGSWSAYSTFIGSYCGASTGANTVTGSYNTGCGYSALRNIITGAASNSAFGSNAGENLTTGTYNLFLGRTSGDNLTTASNCISIGTVDFPSATTSDQFILGNDNGLLLTGAMVTATQATYKTCKMNGILIGEETHTITSTLANGYAAGLRLSPTYTAASSLAVTIHNYIDINDVTLAGSATLGNSCLLKTDAIIGTHSMTEAATTSMDGLFGVIKVSINGVIKYIPVYDSFTP